MQRRFALAGCLMLVLAMLLAAPGVRAAGAAAPRYTVTDLGTLGGPTSFALDINAAGQIVGSAVTIAGDTHPFLYSDGMMTDLGTLGGSFGIGGAINATGQVAGQADTAAGRRHAFRYSAGVMTDLGTLGGADSRGVDINVAGQVVGSSSLGAGGSHAFLYSNGAMTDLGALPGDSDSFANSINAAGQIVGGSAPGGGLVQTHAFLYSNGTMTDLGTLGGSRSVAYQLNDAGQVIGWSDLPGDSSMHAFLYSNGVMTDLGSLGGSFSQAVGINTAGTLVVGSSLTGDNSQHAFLYRCGVLQDLNGLIQLDSGWTLTYAAAINDAEQIVGWGTLNGQRRAFLLTLRSASQFIDDLIALVQSFQLPKGSENSLIVKLRNAQSALASGDTTAAVSKLNAFVHEVNAQAGQALTLDQANQLIAAANAILTGSGCP